MESRSPENSPSRYVVGIDLGTTNSAVTYVDTSIEARRIETFPIPQLVAPGQVESRETLPSFHYQPAEGEFPPKSLQLPWQTQEPGYFVGVFAREQGAKVPGRLVASAKSWLSHTGVDRTAGLLPWHGAPDAERLSPVDASSRYLQHIREAWDAHFPSDRLADQEIVLTLPASFDEVARELTVKAAAQAGLPRVVLIEEPQAAFYAWINKHAHDWDQQVEPGQKILVCDIGGGTSDFTLIRVRRGEGEKVQFHRIAVGDHLILGGDNLDLALAHHLERKLVGEGKLEPRQWSILVHQCRFVKETLLTEGGPERMTVNIGGGGSRLIGGGLQVEVTRDEARELLLEGFFPFVGLNEKPASRRSGFQEFGLPYAPDPAMTRYLAAFLTAHRNIAAREEDVPPGHDPVRPDIVLFNGGVFASDLLRKRLVDVLASWFASDEAGRDWTPIVLDNDRLDLAVARGAAYFGLVRRGEGVRIAAGLARTYYIGVGAAGETETPTAVCLVPAGTEAGQDIDLTQRRFDLLVSEPVEFPLYFSSTRLTDHPGDLVEVDREQMTPLPPMRTVLSTSRKAESGTVSVELHARLTEIGTLDLWCSEVDGRRSWRLQFDVRSATQTDRVAHDAVAEREGFVDEETWERCRELIHETFGPKGTARPEGLMKRLSEVTGMSRRDWPTSLLRRFWEALMEVELGRRRSQAHEARWLNLAGFSLRPGYGLAADDWRVAETRRVLQGRLIHATTMCLTEWWILWRRIAGGLTAGQQQQLAEPLLASIRQTHRQSVTGKGKGGDISLSSHEAAELWRLLGSLELLNPAAKIELGTMVLDLLPRRKMEGVRPALIWTLGRLGARVPLYGPLNSVLPAEVVQKWVRQLLKEESSDSTLQLALMQLARRTDDRYRDLPASLRQEVADWLERSDAPEHFARLVLEGGTLDVEEQGMVFGEALPKGLRIL